MPVQVEESIVPGKGDSGLKGNLSLTNITDLLQFLSSSAKSGMIKLVRHPEGTQGKIYFVAAASSFPQIPANKTGWKGLLNCWAGIRGHFTFCPMSRQLSRPLGFRSSTPSWKLSYCLTNSQRNPPQPPFEKSKKGVFICKMKEGAQQRS